MNLYNLQEFKCTKCQHWFHPKHAQPYQLSCSHSVCARCLTTSNNSKVIFCPHHKSNNQTVKLKLNNHVQSALQRLVKDLSEDQPERNASKPSILAKTLQNLLKCKEQDRHALAQLFERIYNNQINRITHLKNRVCQQILGFEQQVSNWKTLAQNRMNLSDILQQGKVLQDKISTFNRINFQKIANKIITNHSIVTQPHFSIYDLLKTQRSTLKSSLKQINHRFESNFSLLSAKDQKQNNYSSFINKTTQSPEQLNQVKHKFNTNQFFCKELSSFKLDSSFNKQINDQALRNSKLIQQFKLSNSLLEQFDENGQVTLREHEHSKCSLQTKVNDKRQQKKSHFAQLISSLKIQDQLVYSPEKSQDQMLLSEQKHEINFLQQCPIQKRSSKGEIQVRQRQSLNVQREKNKYIRRMEETRTDEAANSTSIAGNTLQLFNYDLKEVDLKAFLDKFDWGSLQAVKFVGTGLQDHQFNILLNYLLNTKVHTVLLPSNELQEISLDALVNFTSLNSHLKTVSLQRNNIHPLQGNCRTKIAMLRQRGITLYI